MQQPDFDVDVLLRIELPTVELGIMQKAHILKVSGCTQLAQHNAYKTA